MVISIVVSMCGTVIHGANVMVYKITHIRTTTEAAADGSQCGHMRLTVFLWQFHFWMVSDGIRDAVRFACIDNSEHIRWLRCIFVGCRRVYCASNTMCIVLNAHIIKIKQRHWYHVTLTHLNSWNTAFIANRWCWRTHLQKQTQKQAREVYELARRER